MTKADAGPNSRGRANRQSSSVRPLPTIRPRPEPLANIDQEQIRLARENRLRVAFLATKGNTMSMWLVQCFTILSGDDESDCNSTPD